MWRRIGGIIVGWLAGVVLSMILFMVIAAVMGRGGLLTADGQLSTASIVVLLSLGAVANYLAGAIARAIGRDKLTIYIFLGLSVVLIGVSFAMQGAAAGQEQPAIPEETPEFFKTLAEFGRAQQEAPQWLGIVSALVSLGALALGGLNKSDFVKPVSTPQDWSQPPGGQA